MPTGRTGQVVGYARVSAADQNLDRQLDALAGVDQLFTERASGRSGAQRPALAQMLAYVRAGDTVRVTSPDRLARSTLDLLAMVADLSAREVAVEFLSQPALSTAEATGAFTLTILAAVAELERSMIRERQAEGIAAARARGVYARGPSLSPQQIATAAARVADGIPKAAEARRLGVARSTLHDALAGRGRYAPDAPAPQTRSGQRPDAPPPPSVEGGADLPQERP